MRSRVFILLRNTALIIGCGGIYYLVVTLAGFSLPCVFHEITGLFCPGCGVSRMCISLIRLDFISAFWYNPVIFTLLPVWIAALVPYLCRYLKYGERTVYRWQKAVVWFSIAALLAFGVLRNVFDIGLLHH